MKKYLIISIIFINSIYGFNNHFFGFTGSVGTIYGENGDSATVLDDEDFLVYGFKTGIITDDIIVYVDYGHMNFNNSGLSGTNGQTNFNEDYMSLVLGPVFEMDIYIDTYLFLNGVLAVDKFHYSREDETGTTSNYISQYQLHYGYQFGVIFPVILNPFDTEIDSFFEIGYRQVYRSRSLLAGSEDEDLQIPFKDLQQYYLSVNILF